MQIYKKQCIICKKEIVTPEGFLGRCCSDQCAQAYEEEEGYTNEDDL